MRLWKKEPKLSAPSKEPLFVTYLARRNPIPQKVDFYEDHFVYGKKDSEKCVYSQVSSMTEFEHSQNMARASSRLANLVEG